MTFEYSQPVNIWIGVIQIQILVLHQFFSSTHQNARPSLSTVSYSAFKKRKLNLWLV